MEREVTMEHKQSPSSVLSPHCPHPVLQQHGQGGVATHHPFGQMRNLAQGVEITQPGAGRAPRTG